MRVLHVIPSVSPRRGGPSFAVVAMVKALRAAGVEAEIATTNDDGEGVLSVPCGERSEFNGVPVRFFPRWSPPVRALREFAYARGLAPWLGAAVRGFDVVHVHALFSFASTTAMRICRHARVPYFSRPLGQLCAWAIQRRALKKRLYLALAERTNLRGAARVHFTTEQERRQAEEVEPGLRGFVVPHGIELPAPLPMAREQLRTRLGLPSDEPVILFLGRLHPVKGLGLLIPALAEVARQTRFTFVLAGHAETPDYEQEVTALLARHGLAERTCRVGFAEGEWKQILLQGADVFALTSHSENFGLAVVEALAAGRPVVLSPGVALAEWVARHQLGEVPLLEVGDLARALGRCLETAGQDAAFSLRARQVVAAEFAWPAVAARLRGEYERATAC